MSDLRSITGIDQTVEDPLISRASRILIAIEERLGETLADQQLDAVNSGNDRGEQCDETKSPSSDQFYIKINHGDSLIADVTQQE